MLSSVDGFGSGLLPFGSVHLMLFRRSRADAAWYDRAVDFLKSIFICTVAITFDVSDWFHRKPSSLRKSRQPKTPVGSKPTSSAVAESPDSRRKPGARDGQPVHW
jgi:hypothetical protein